MNFTKISKADLDSPSQALFNGGPKIVVALSVCSGINFVCVYTGGQIQL